MRAAAFVALLFGALVPVVAAHAQGGFEAASVKEHVAPGDGSLVGRQPGGRFGAQNASLREIIEYAYEIQGFQLAGNLTPVEAARWDITATLGAAGAQSGPDAIAPAVKALLADRFALVAHRETRTMQVYALRLARADGAPGAALKKSALDCRALMAAARNGGGRPPPEARQ